MINIKKELTSMAEIISDKKPSSAANTNARTANIADKGVPISEPNQKLLNELITQINSRKFSKFLGVCIFYGYHIGS